MAKKKGNEKSGGAKDFTLVSGFNNGYRNREDITTLPPGVLVKGSQNVLTNTYQRVGIRRGYTLDGQANTDQAPIAGGGPAMGVFDWFTSGGGERNMRAGYLTDLGNDGKLQFRHVDATGAVTWIDLVTGLSSVDFNYITFWDEDSLSTVMLCVNGESNIRSWNGATLEMFSAANPTGIVNRIDLEPGTGSDSELVSTGGVDYVVGDRLTLSGGASNAVIEVIAITAGAIKTVSVTSGGTGYVVGDTVLVSGGGVANFAALEVATESGGVVTGLTIRGNGHGYSIASGVTTTTNTGTGAGLTVNISAIGNAVSDWDFTSDADHGTGYSGFTSYALTGGTGNNARVEVFSVTSGTITKSGTESWAEAGFVFQTTSSESSILINGNTYTYQSQTFLGDTTTLYGVSPDPSAEPSGSLVIQAMVTWPNTGGNDGLPENFSNDLIGTLNARVFIGSLTSSYLYLSEYVSFKDWVGSSTFVLTSPPTALIPQEQAIYLSAGHDEWYKIAFILSADLESQLAQIDRLNTTAQQAAQGQGATTKIANSIAFLSFEPIIETFGPVENVFLGPQMVDLSFPIVNDMNAYDFTGASLFYYRKFIYIAVPRESLVLIYNMTDAKNPYWEAPQVMPIARFSIIGGELYGHSSLVSETYKLFTGTNDNGFAIEADAAFSFNNYGTRSQTKGYNQFYVEGYISANTELTLGIQFEIDGCATNMYFEIEGSDNAIVCIAPDEGSLGKASLGKHPLGGGLVSVENPGRPKFRVIKTFVLKYFYEDHITFSSSGIDQDWEIVGFGPQLIPYNDLNNSISQ